jgi:RNA polymerase sigma factor for flagellar operon FliA
MARSTTLASELPPVDCHLDLVYVEARRLVGRLPAGLTFDDLVSAGSEALCRVRHTFDPARGIAFPVYARRRVIGAMLDEIRALRRSQRTPNFTTAEFEELDAWRASVGLSGAFREPGTRRPVRNEASSGARRELDVEAALAHLQPRQRDVLRLHYRIGLTLREIARHLGLSVPRVHQIKNAALAKLRRRVQG